MIRTAVLKCDYINSHDKNRTKHQFILQYLFIILTPIKFVCRVQFLYFFFSIILANEVGLCKESMIHIYLRVS